MSHTPGPWNSRPAGEGSCESFYVLTDADMQGVWIATVQGTHVGDKNPDVNEANARLIAAAPELLKWAEDAFAKQNCVCKLNPLVGGPVPCQTCQLGSLIAKATGGAR